MKPLIDAATLLATRPPAARARAAAAAPEATATHEIPAPALVGLRLAEYTVLAGIPLRYLIPDPARLPDDALRFFHLNPDWLEALLDGILSIGLGEEATAATPATHAAAAAALPLIRDARRGRATGEASRGTGQRPGQGVAGMLLRSTLVERWPGLIVRAYLGTVAAGQDPETTATATALVPLRLERLTPSVLVALWAQPPDLVVIQEPPSALRLGFHHRASGPVVRVRRADGSKTGTEVAVPVNAATGTVDMAALATALHAAGHIIDAGDSAALAMQLLRPPVRRRFCRTATP